MIKLLLDLKIIHANLVREASLRTTGLNRRLEIRSQLTQLRRLSRIVRWIAIVVMSLQLKLVKERYIC